MDVIINSVCAGVPEGSRLLASQGSALLNLLVSLKYDPLNPPVADLLRQYKRLEGDWLMLSPVHWQASHNDAMIIAAGDDLQLDDIQSQSWFQRYADYLAEEQMTLHYYESGLWLICVNQKPSINAKPVHHILNKSLMPELALLDTSMYWQKFITESQMFFASLPNETALNGVWLWGGARLDGQSPMSICADEHFLELAKICSSNVSPYSPSLELKKFQIVLLNDFDVLSTQHKFQLKKLRCNWYWNDFAYTQSDSNWITRLWRTLIHAH